jgi:hypothetical protein
VELEENPFNIEGKRIKFNEDQTSGVLSYRMFRIAFSIENQTITLKQIYSGYSKDELNTLEDKYNDKDIHRQFTQNFN